MNTDSRARARMPDLIEARRSIRSFTDEPVAADLLDTCIEAACRAPAPHHSWPWRFVTLDGAALEVLSGAMAEAWRIDLEADGIDAGEIRRLLDASRTRIGSAPAAILGCLVWNGLDRYPDETRRQAEWGMARLSLGAAVQNLMLTATSAGLASCWVAAPIFCSEAARDSLKLDAALYPEALVLLGHPDPAYTPMQRPEIDLAAYKIERGN